MSDHINIARLKAVADILSGLKEEIVFVGGATVSLYAAKPELTTIRATDDVDVVVELVTKSEFYLLQERLLSLGFQHDRNAPIISRFLYQGIKVDFMPIEPTVLGFTNRWYEEGIRQKIKVDLDNSTSIYIFSAPYFLASKMEAFLKRGKGDFFASHDLEDIVYVLDHRPIVQNEIMASPTTVKTYLLEEFARLRNQHLFEEALLGHVEQQNSLQRATKIIELLKQLK
jgi:predicted nucleotidyltransferase